MVRFVHTADWQLGAPNLPPACQRPIAALIAAARVENASFIVCAGDIFHKHSPDQQTKDYLLHVILSNPDMFFIFMAGNHDYINKERDYTSLKYLSLLSRHKKVTNAYVIEPGRYITFKNVIFWALDDWDDVKNVQAPQDKSKPTIAIWHGIVPGINVKNINYDESNKKEHSKQLTESGIDYLALGDIHKQVQLNDRCYYSGALTQTSYVDDLGALFVTAEKETVTVKPLKLDLPKKVSFAVEYREGKDTEEDIITFVKANVRNNNLVKIKFNLPLEIYSAINKTYVEEQLKSYCLAVVFDNDPIIVARSRKNIEQITQAATFEQEIDIVLADEDFDLDKNEIKKRIMDILNHTEVD
jgi:DNA repair exonuclease SbcCD nuclease subunit